MCGYSLETQRLGVERGGGGMTLPLLQYAARFNGGGQVLGCG